MQRQRQRQVQRRRRQAHGEAEVKGTADILAQIEDRIGMAQAGNQGMRRTVSCSDAPLLLQMIRDGIKGNAPKEAKPAPKKKATKKRTK